jgi:hypothetical protein
LFNHFPAQDRYSPRITYYLDNMKDTEDDLDEIEESQDQSKLALLIGVMCIIGLAIGIYFKPGAKPTITIEMPEPPPIQKDENAVADTAYVIYTLQNDSILLYIQDTLLFTTLSPVFSDTSLINEIRNEIVLIKETLPSDHKTMMHAIENSNM